MRSNVFSELLLTRLSLVTELKCLCSRCQLSEEGMNSDTDESLPSDLPSFVNWILGVAKQFPALQISSLSSNPAGLCK